MLKLCQVQSILSKLTIVLICLSTEIVKGTIQLHLPQPMIFSSPKVYHVQLGDEIMLECEVQNLGPMILLWKQGARVLTAGNMTVRRDSRLRLDGTHLIISNTEVEDRGDYDCEIERDKEDPISIRHKLDILVPPTVFPEPSSRSVIVKEGNSISISCSARGNPHPAIYWKKINGPEQPSGEVLSLTNINRLDEGDYECTADNSVGAPSTAVINVHVLYAPVVEAKHARVLGGVGRNVELTCIVQSDPESEVKWYKNVVRELSNIPNIRYTRKRGKEHSLVLEAMTEVDFGDYHCEAKNNLGSGKAHLRVSGEPTRPVFSNHVDKIRTGVYRISWIVKTFRPITEHIIYYRKIKGVGSQDWKKLVVQESYHAVEEEKFSLDLTELEEDVLYEIQVECSNIFGKSEISEVFEFATTSKDIEVEPESRVQPETNIFSFFRTSGSESKLLSSSHSILYMTSFVLVLRTLSGSSSLLLP